MGFGAGSGVGAEGAGTGPLTGLAGRDGWRGAGAAVDAGRGAGDDTAAGASCDGVDGAGAGDAAADAAAAFARAWAMRSAALERIFLRISILASSNLILLTQSCTSPALYEGVLMSDKNCESISTHLKGI